MTSRSLLLVALVVGAAAYFGVGAVVGRDRHADLIVVQDVPDDVRIELESTWGRFIDTFDARRGCFGDVSIVLVRDVDGGDARYVVADAAIEVQIPTTPARFRESLTHELAHHVEKTCDEFAEVREVLHARLGGSARPWTGGDVWTERPSEVWAETVVQLVNGERLLHSDDMPISPVLVDLVGAWARGDAVH